MNVNIFTDQMQHAQLFGRPVLITSQTIPRETVPDGWHCYDIQGVDSSPGGYAKLVDCASFFYSGAVLSPAPLKRPATAARRIGKGDCLLHSEEMDLEAFCEEYGLDFPENPIKFELRPASPDEAGIFYALPPEQDEELGAIGHVRIDFGRSGGEFWHTWWPRGPEGLNSPEFRDELGQVTDQLRRGVLKDLSTMLRWCHSHGGKISDSYPPQYGYVVETGRYRYCLRCNPVRGDYQAYLTAFDLQAQQMVQGGAQGQAPGYRWYVTESPFDDSARREHELPLDEAIQLYVGLDCQDKQLGVIRDDGASADLAICLSGFWSFPEGWRKREDLAQDKTLADAAAQVRQMVDSLTVGRISFASGERYSFTDPQKYVAAIHKELPYHPTTGFRYETLTDDPAIRKAVDVEVYDLYGMEPPWQEAECADEHQTGPEMGGIGG